MGVALVVALLIASLFHAIQASSYVIDTSYERFEDATVWWLALLPTFGLMAILVLYRLLNVDGREVGITHTLERLHRRIGIFPWRNAAMQYFAGGIALATGFSGGREGPGLHLGAWVAHVCELRFGFTRDDREMLLRVGMIAAIAAGVHTILAAFCFVLEVIRIRRPPLRTLFPMVLASLIATGVSKALNVDPLLLSDQDYGFLHWQEWLLITGLAVVFAIVAVLANQLTVLCTKVNLTFPVRMVILTVATTICALFMPEALGVGFDSFVLAERGELQLGLLYLLMFVAAKFILTSVGVALGLPLGIVGPTIVNGGLLGSLCYLCLVALFPEVVSSHVSLYVLMASVTLLAAVLNAPITAAVLFFELTLNPIVSLQVAIPILAAHVCKIKLWGNQSIFEARLAAQGIHLSTARV